MATRKTKTTQEFTITKVNYPKTLMFGEDYNFSQITVETDLTEDITINKIEGTWLDAQPPFDVMGFYPLQITAYASNGAVGTTTVNIFVFYKPHDGFHKFAIYRYTDGIRLLSYDCSDNEEDTKLYCYNTTISIKEIGKNNAYSGQIGYLFNEETKQWDYDNSKIGYPDYCMRASFTAKEVLYCNSNIYEKDMTTLYYKADKKKEGLPMWDKDVENRYVAEYTDLRDFDDTVEAFFIQQGSYNSVTATYALAFRNISGDSINLKLMPKSGAKPRLEHDDINAEHALFRYQNGKWDIAVAWKKQQYTATLVVPSDKELGNLSLMNASQEFHKVTISVCDINGENGYMIVGKKQVSEGRKAKYRMKNENGEYDIIHFETSMKQVIGLDEVMANVEESVADRYTKAETVALFDDVEAEIQSVEEIADGLNTRLTVAEGEVSKLQSDLANEVNRATSVEAGLQTQINGLDTKVEAINHADTGILANANAYTDSEIANLKDGAVKDLSDRLANQENNLQGSIDNLTGIVETNKVAIEETVSDLDGRVAVVEGKVSDLESTVEVLTTEDTRLAEEIQKVKDVLANKGSNTLVFATHDEFVNATLTPKVGDLAFIIESKRAYIYQGTQGWILFDEISTEVDLVDYIKKAEVVELLSALDNKLAIEVQRALTAEQGLQEQVDELTVNVDKNTKDIKGLEATVEEHSNTINELKEEVYTREEVDALIDEAITAQMSYIGRVEPIGKKAGHVWIETI